MSDTATGCHRCGAHPKENMNVEEPTKVEFDNAVGEVVKTLEQCIWRIREIMEDITCELIDE